ncbi:MAG: sigma-70 family RNA polymerase sigma factor [Bacteroidetes bacterium]|jgi:RNA polymerase sigma factor (sigma-70 family)|nr:MAG: sigma-70 family RNA polymerase sigma factor [Bacteroidota bacterium]
MIRLDDQEDIATKSLDDSKIVQEILEGKKDLYTVIIRRYNQRLFRIGLSIIDDESVIEEIMQIAYIKAYENLEKFRFEARFSTWLIRILVNESLMYLKRREQTYKRSKNHLETDVLQSSVEYNTPLKEMLNSELRTALESSIKALPEKYRTVFIVRVIENMSVAETMECLELTEASVKVRLNRAKIMLRNKLNSYVQNEEIMQFYKPRCDKMVDAVMKRVLQIDIT